MYYDTNNLYDWAINQQFLYSGFQWTNKIKIRNGKGWILEVDLEYHEELHKLHYDYPLAPEKLAVKKDWFSEYQTELLENKSMINISKLVPNLMGKSFRCLPLANYFFILCLSSNEGITLFSFKQFSKLSLLLVYNYAHMSSAFNLNGCFVCLQRNDVSKALCRRVVYNMQTHFVHSQRSFMTEIYHLEMTHTDCSACLQENASCDSMSFSFLIL